MGRTDKDIDNGLQQLPQLAPEASAWAELEKQLSSELSPKRKVWGRFRHKAMIPMGSGIAAMLALVAIIVFTRSGLEGVWPQSTGGLEAPAQVATGQTFRADKSDVRGAGSQPQGKFVRHLYAGDEALWDAMLEEEIHLVDLAILRSSPVQQRKLWLYRTSLVKQLTALRHQPVPEKYLF